MNIRVRYGMAVLAVLLAAGSLLAAQPGAQNAAGLMFRAGPVPPATMGKADSGNLHDNDVGVAVIISPNDTALPFGDRAFPRGRVQNFGSKTQTNIAVICVIYDSTAGSRVYGPETAYVASLDSGAVAAVSFAFWAPSPQENVYFDTMTTVLPGDQDTTNDWRAGRFAVAVRGEGRLSYNDGTFENAVTWVYAGSQLTERFAAPDRPLTLDKAVIWLTSMSGDSYDAEVRVYANDGPGGNPGTELGAWTGQLQTDTWMLFRRNEIAFDPPIEVDYDTFFVSWYETSIDPHYPYIALDQFADTIDIGNDWGWLNKDGARTWGLFPLDQLYDFAIDAICYGVLLDGSPREIVVPPARIDSNSTFTPQIKVKNAGLCDRDSIVVEFFITSSSDGGDTLYADTASSGPIKSGQTKTVTFADSVALAPGYYTMASITLLPYDGKSNNDTLVRSLAVGRPGVEGEKVAAGRASFAIAPNPTAKVVAVHYSLPEAGPATLNVYDVSGRVVLSQTIAAGRTGTASLDLRKLGAGIYMVKLGTNGFSATQKLVIER
jgi:hypothetical protein